jgi:hypothetical protein
MSPQEILADMRNGLHEDFGLMLQVEAQTTEAEMRINKKRMNAKCGLKEKPFKKRRKPIKREWRPRWAPIKERWRMDRRR